MFSVKPHTPHPTPHEKLFGQTLIIAPPNSHHCSLRAANH
ncbi:hypothetical protein O53_2027 [Microcystis aeruginosa TAIHU98]|uniref:Uncharacterized protein n=1 Tax=Microcystis aeruginosa TAIHU98 TaxID=1134457 RepID=L7E3J0_MICAE|nr:hypothetical protein O53_2027 [Microcystis aeruginosa TAIHU98]